MIKPLNQMDLREITQHLCFRYQEHFEERDEEDTLYNFFSQMLISLSLSQNAQNELMP